MRSANTFAFLAAFLAVSPVSAAEIPTCDVPFGWNLSTPPKEAAAQGITFVLTHETDMAMIGLGLYPADRSPKDRAEHFAKLLERLGVRVTSKRSDKKAAVYEWGGPSGSNIVGRIVIKTLKPPEHIAIIGFWPATKPKLSDDINRVAASARKP